MNDKEILEEVYRRTSDRNNWVQPFLTLKEIKDFIEQEWQKADEKKVNPQQEAGIDY